MARPQIVVDGVDSFQTWRVVVNVLNKQEFVLEGWELGWG
jgi:hypothetical protein